MDISGITKLAQVEDKIRALKLEIRKLEHELDIEGLSELKIRIEQFLLKNGKDRVFDWEDIREQTTIDLRDGYGLGFYNSNPYGENRMWIYKLCHDREYSNRTYTVRYEMSYSQCMGFIYDHNL